MPRFARGEAGPRFEQAHRPPRHSIFSALCSAFNLSIIQRVTACIKKITNLPLRLIKVHLEIADKTPSTRSFAHFTRLAPSTRRLSTLFAFFHQPYPPSLDFIHSPPPHPQLPTPARRHSRRAAQLNISTLHFLSGSPVPQRDNHHNYHCRHP